MSTRRVAATEARAPHRNIFFCEFASSLSAMLVAHSLRESTRIRQSCPPGTALISAPIFSATHRTGKFFLWVSTSLLRTLSATLMAHSSRQYCRGRPYESEIQRGRTDPVYVVFRPESLRRGYRVPKRHLTKARERHILNIRKMKHPLHTVGRIIFPASPVPTTLLSSTGYPRLRPRNLACND
jgi:hypothetical protein